MNFSRHTQAPERPFLWVGGKFDIMSGSLHELTVSFHSGMRSRQWWSSDCKLGRLRVTFVQLSLQRFGIMCI